jgi:enoyl-CoA hydratase
MSFVELTRQQEFAVIRITRTDALNALNYGMLREIGALLDQVEASDARALFFTGTGDKAFCAGADIGELLDRSIPAEFAGTRLGQSCFRESRTLACRRSPSSTAMRWAAAASLRWPAPSASARPPPALACRKSSLALFPATAARNACHAWWAWVSRSRSS